MGRISPRELKGLQGDSDYIRLPGMRKSSRKQEHIDPSKWKKTRNPTKVAIIGSGVAGLTAAKYLLAEHVKDTPEPYFEITIFERHSEVAGIWNITSPTDTFTTPMYDGLETNVPRTLMEFKDFPYPKDVALFPTHDKIKEYLESYANDIRHLISFNSEVVKVTKVTKNYCRKWKVEIKEVEQIAKRENGTEKVKSSKGCIEKTTKKEEKVEHIENEDSDNEGIGNEDSESKNNENDDGESDDSQNENSDSDSSDHQNCRDNDTSKSDEDYSESKPVKIQNNRTKIDETQRFKNEKPNREHWFDCVVVATGTMNKFYSPPEHKLDLKSWEAKYPGSVVHAGEFRTPPEDFKDKKVLIIGGGPSYWDIAKQISPLVDGEIIVSTRKRLEFLSTTNQVNVENIAKLHIKTRSATLVDGTIVHDIDKIVLCTGYELDFGFCPKLQLKDNGQIICDLWNQMFWIPDISLAFVGLPKMGATMAIAEAQSAYIARVFSLRIKLPSWQVMYDDLEEELNKAYEGCKTDEEGARKFHSFNEGKDRKVENRKDKLYVNSLYEECKEADGTQKAGKQPPYLGIYFNWTRKNLGAMRNSSNAKGANKYKYPTPESLGFKDAPRKDVDEI